MRITVSECSGQAFALMLRIPGWAKSASARVNLGPPVETSAPGTYFELRRTWKGGDTLDLDIPMPVQLVEANPLVEDTLNQLAVKRGPVVYCLESPDLPKDVRVMDVSVPAKVDLQARYDEQLLGGVAALDGSLLARPAGEWQGLLYRELKTSTPKPIKVQLIPYYVWANRGKSEMSVWLQRD